jgi:hypothetical protein
MKNKIIISFLTEKGILMKVEAPFSVISLIISFILTVITYFIKVMIF